MGQDPTFFGYNDYEDEDNNSNRFKNALETMQEEDELDEDDLQAAARLRARSKSSGAAFGLLSSTQHAHLRRVSTQQEDQRRRSSATLYSQLSMSDKERLEHLQRNGRRLSQQSDYADRPSSFQRRQSMTTQQPIQQLADQLENTHLRQDNFPSMPPPLFRPDMFSHMPAPLPHLAYHPQPPMSHSFLHQPPPSTTDESEPHSRTYQEMGKGVPLHRVSRESTLYMIEFKAGRTDFFYVSDRTGRLQPHVGDLVIVEADRGQDLGKVAINNLTADQVKDLHTKQQQQQQQQQENESSENRRDIQVKRIYRLAAPDEINLLLIKGQDEQRALAVCQEKTKLRKLPMEVVDAEYQW
ncbi:hypothetical protein DFQ30_004215 [Apophysomyces sp. BC1015]|nr:hypothetical protein DFQ30_004215 [Apophysomyces sp. BC1015]